MGTLILSKRMIVPLFMPFAFIGLMSIFFGGLIFFIDSHFNPIRIGIPLAIGTVSLVIAARARLAFFNEETGEVSLSWGKTLPWVYQTHPKNSWKALKVEKRYPVMVTGTRTSSLPPRWNVTGLTKQGESVLLSESGTETDAIAWQKILAKSFNLKNREFNAKVYLSNEVQENIPGKADQEIAKEASEQASFFKKDSTAHKLYAEICASNNWDHVHAKSIYDADATNELGTSYFNIPLLASNAQIKNPWKVVARLQESGWIEASQKELDQLVMLEKKYGWATPDML